MRKSLLLILIGAALAACTAATPQSAEYTQNGIKVELLFEQDDCKVYKFWDGNIRAVYYADCKASATVSYDENCGKNCTRSVVNTSSKAE